MDNRFIAGNILSFCVGLRGMHGISFWPDPVPVAGGTGEVDGGQSRMQGAIQAGMQEVKNTWQEVERIAASYDVAL